MNEHDLHDAFGDLARRGADDQAGRMREGAGLSAERVTSAAGRRRRRRAATGTVTGVVAVTSLVLAGSALADRPTPQPADTPSPTITRPVPAPSDTPAPPTPTAPVVTTGPSGVIEAYPTAPTSAWTTAGGELWTATDPGLVGSSPVLGDVTASSHSYPAFRAIVAAGTWLVAAGVPVDEQLVGVGSDDGTVRWALDAAEAGMCAGVYDGLLVCLGTSTGTAMADLRDPTTGEVVRSVSPGDDGMPVFGIAMADGAVVFHGSVGADLRVRVVDLSTGAVRADRTVPGAVDTALPIGDGVVTWESAGSVVLVHGGQYAFAVDARSGSLLGQGLDVLLGVRADGWVTGYGADGGARAAGPAGEDVTLPGDGVRTPRVWAPDAGVDIPLLTGSDVTDGEPDRVQAVDPDSGDVLWSVDGVAVVQALAGRTAVLLGDDELVGVDVRTGAELWRSAPANSVGYDGILLVVDGVGEARAIDAADGSVAWTLPHAASAQLVAVGDGLALVGADGSLSALRP